LSTAHGQKWADHPEKDEQGLYYADAAATSSACLSRQVGAAIMDGGGNILAVGKNDVPKAGGGLYDNSDNGNTEAAFRTLKYRPNYPDKPFADMQAARGWVQGFVDWYNYEHRHSAIKFVTPAQRHDGEDIQILADRRQVYLKARSANPLRWSGNIRNWDPIGEVYLNPGKQKVEKEVYKAA